MKRIILIIVLLSAFLGLQAQNFGLSSNGTYTEYTGTAADTISGATTITKTFKINKTYLYYYDILVDIDTVSGGGGNSVSCVLYGSNDNVNFTSISDVTYGASADTIFSYTNIASRFVETNAAHTVITTAYTITQDTTGLDYITDSIYVPEITNTVAAQTNTVAESGVMWNYFKLLMTGDGASAAVELQAIKVKVVKIP